MVDTDLIPAAQESRLTIVRTECGKVIRANSEQPLIDWLLDNEVISAEMHFAGLDFMERLRYHRAMQDAKLMNYSESRGGEMADLLFTQIIKRMQARHVRLVEDVGTLAVSENRKALYRGLAEYVRDAFDELIRATCEAKQETGCH